MNQQNNAEIIMGRWIVAEQWFMRGAGVALFLVAAISLSGGLLNDPNHTAPLQAVNVIIALLAFGAALWSIWSSTRIQNIREMIERFAQQSPNRLRINGAMQVVVALLFLLDGMSRGAGGVLLVGALLVVSAVWAFWRAEQISALNAA
jgi:uncharacterized membrane protein